MSDFMIRRHKTRNLFDLGFGHVDPSQTQPDNLIDIKEPPYLTYSDRYNEQETNRLP